MSYTYSFEKLQVWNEARKLVVWIYKITKAFPAEEKFGLIMQLRRASVSVISNIAEGSARITPKDKANFYQMAYSSIIEILNQLIVSIDLEFINNAMMDDGRKKIENLTVKVAALRNAELTKL